MNGDYIIIFLADGLMLPIIIGAAIALIYYVPNNKKFEVFSRIILAGLTALLVAKLMAAAYQPAAARPFELMGVDPGASYLNNPGFPSDHALFAAAIAYAVWYGAKKKWLTILFAIAVMLVCVGRILALVHTPLDVFGGIAAASVGALWYVNDSKKQKTKSR